MATDYNLVLVAISYLLSVLGSFTALKLASGIPHSDSKGFWGWLAGAAFALGGGGIWAMHFVGMLAFETPLDFGYDPMWTLLSLVLAVLVVGSGLWVVGRRPDSLMALLGAGVITGLGVATMHYTGMEAMVMPGTMYYDMSLVLVSILIAVGAAICALWLAFNVSGNAMRMVAALVMGVAVCGMHYTGMAAMHLDFGLAERLTLADLQYASAIDADIMATLIAVVALAVLLSLLLGSHFSLQKQERATALRIDD